MSVMSNWSTKQNVPRCCVLPSHDAQCCFDEDATVHMQSSVHSLYAADWSIWSSCRTRAYRDCHRHRTRAQCTDWAERLHEIGVWCNATVIVISFHERTIQWTKSRLNDWGIVVYHSTYSVSFASCKNPSMSAIWLLTLIATLAPRHSLNHGS